MDIEKAKIVFHYMDRLEQNHLKQRQLMDELRRAMVGRVMGGMNMDYVLEDVARLEKKIVRAEKEGSDTFVYEGNEYYVGYAKYLCEHLRQQFGMPPKNLRSV